MLLAFAVAFYLILRHHDDTTKAAASKRGAGGAPVSLTTATATQGNLGVYLDAIGTVTPVYTTSVTSQVNGVINVVHYKEGQIVRKGAPLVDIDSRPYRATLLQAQGTLERDQNILAQAKMDLERYRTAWSRDAIPKQTLDDQEKLVLHDEGTVEIDQGVVQYDQIQVDYCHITAPITGRVGLRLVDPGNVVQSTGATTLFVTHDQAEALALGHRVAVMREGRVEQIGSARDLYERPANVFVAEFIGILNQYVASHYAVEERVLEGQLL